MLGRPKSWHAAATSAMLPTQIYTKHEPCLSGAHLYSLMLRTQPGLLSFSMGSSCSRAMADTPALTYGHNLHCAIASGPSEPEGDRSTRYCKLSPDALCDDIVEPAHPLKVWELHAHSQLSHELSDLTHCISAASVEMSNADCHQLQWANLPHLDPARQLCVPQHLLQGLLIHVLQRLRAMHVSDSTHIGCVTATGCTAECAMICRQTMNG